MDLKKLNSLTKYPSILTYHALGERGRLQPALAENRPFPDGETLYAYEKVDGENARIVLFRSERDGDGKAADYVIGSREELLYARGDRIGNPYGNIAEFLKPLAERLCGRFQEDDSAAVTVIFMESYGGKTKAAKNYTGSQTQGYRVFDLFSLTREELSGLLALPPDKIADWRERGKQPFHAEERKRDFVRRWELSAAPLLDEIDAAAFPRQLEPTFDFLKKFADTSVGIDASGQSEGLIVRTADRGMIRKIRFEDYVRTFKS